MEQWCEGIARHAAEQGDKLPRDYVGFTEIITESMQQSGWCDGRTWRILQEIVDRNRLKYGKGGIGEPGYICEHMLEID